MKTKFTMMMAVIATFAISLNLHSSNEGVKSTVLLRTIGQTVKWPSKAQCVSVKTVNAVMG